MPTITSRTRLRADGRLTLPAAITKAAGIDVGTVFVVEMDTSEPDVVLLRRVRSSYAGALPGVYAPVDASLKAERDSWS